MGLIWTRPPKPKMTAAKKVSSAVALIVYCGQSRLPTMFCSVLPGPAKSVCPGAKNGQVPPEKPGQG